MQQWLQHQDDLGFLDQGSAQPRHPISARALGLPVINRHAIEVRQQGGDAANAVADRYGLDSIDIEPGTGGLIAKSVAMLSSAGSSAWGGPQP
ncbi:hypothetical protein [Aquimonas sp.]|uniref:hypothetical protein n=1 Tax=Aquimonas sp. TaxID=1872588 RepID=UPI0037C10426